MNPILYLGDDDTTRAAAYLSGILTHYELPFERINSDRSPEEDFLSKEYSLYVLSDYPRSRFSESHLRRIRDSVEKGAGLLMIGGWESFYGRVGEYHDTVLAEILPVLMEERDDRRNYYQPLYLRKVRSHDILDGLPWSTPPSIGGFNAIRPKNETKVILEGVRFELKITDDDLLVNDCRKEGACSVDGHPMLNRADMELYSGNTMIIAEIGSVPILVLGAFGEGKTAAFASDVAPHWVGGLVDWGDRRVHQELPEGGFIEIGNHYAQFFHNLVRWTARE